MIPAIRAVRRPTRSRAFNTHFRHDQCRCVQRGEIVIPFFSKTAAAIEPITSQRMSQRREACTDLMASTRSDEVNLNQVKGSGIKGLSAPIC